jgi:hypothetical protein
MLGHLLAFVLDFVNVYFVRVLKFGAHIRTLRVYERAGLPWVCNHGSASAYAAGLAVLQTFSPKRGNA